MARSRPWSRPSSTAARTASLRTAVDPHLRRDPPFVRRPARLRRRLRARLPQGQGPGPRRGRAVACSRSTTASATSGSARWTQFVDFYRDVLGFAQLIHYDDKVIHTDYSALMSKVMTNGNGRIKFPINEPATGKKKSQIQEYLDWYRSPGCQHIALRTEDIVGTVRRLRDNGVEFLGLPHEYYATLADRVGDVGVPIDTLEELGIEADRDEEGYLLQIFTPPGPGSPDVLLRDHRAPRLARLRRRQLQGAVRGDRARAGEAREPLGEAPALATGSTATGVNWHGLDDRHGLRPGQPPGVGSSVDTDDDRDGRAPTSTRTTTGTFRSSECRSQVPAASRVRTSAAGLPLLHVQVPVQVGASWMSRRSAGVDLRQSTVPAGVVVRRARVGGRTCRRRSAVDGVQIADGSARLGRSRRSWPAADERCRSSPGSRRRRRPRRPGRWP